MTRKPPPPRSPTGPFYPPVCGDHHRQSLPCSTCAAWEKVTIVIGLIGLIGFVFFAAIWLMK